MPTLAPPPANATRRAARLRLRPDLEMVPVGYGRQRYWVIKDPLSLRYFHLPDEEYRLLLLLDGSRDLAQVHREFNRLLAPRMLARDRLQAFLARLHQDGLLISDAPGQGEQLHLRRQQNKRRKRLTRWMQILAIRFRGVDPEPWLARTYPYLWWMFSAWFLLVCLCLCVGALALVASEWGEVRQRLPEYEAFFTLENLLLFAVALAGVKVIHELGHAFAVKHYGGECHEIGLMLLVFTPCLYCNVSDAWMLPERRQRAGIAAAGILVELVLAAVATYLWWWSEPGLLNTLLLSTVFVCSVNTLLFNGNPLLRYDGYFVFADLIGVPNLAERSRALLYAPLARWCLGLRTTSNRALPERKRGLLLTYAICSMAYRWFVLIAILWMLHEFLSRYKMQVVGQIIIATVLVGVAMPALLYFGALLSNPIRREQINRRRAGLALLAVLAIASLLWWVPVPHRVGAVAMIEPGEAALQFVTIPGAIEKIYVEPGQTVAAGDPLLKLTNPELEREIAKLEGEWNSQRLHVQSLADRRLGEQLPAAREALEDIAGRLEQRRKDAERLIVRARTSGSILPAPARSEQETPPDVLAGWRGHPLDKANLGAYLETGTLVCFIGERAQLQPMLLVDQGKMEFVRRGQNVRLLLDQLPGQILSGSIEEISTVDLEQVPEELLSEGRIAARKDRGGVARPVTTLYQAGVRLDRSDAPLLLRARGRAKIIADPQPLGRRLLRYLSGAFRLG